MVSSACSNLKQVVGCYKLLTLVSKLGASSVEHSAARGQRTEGGPNSSDPDDPKPPSPKPAPIAAYENNGEAPWRTLWKELPSSSRFLIAKEPLPETRCNKCTRSEFGKLGELNWSLDKQSSGTCWQCLMVLTLAERILGRPLSGETVGVCRVECDRYCCYQVDGDKDPCYVERLHIRSGPGLDDHIMFNVSSLLPSKLLPNLLVPGTSITTEPQTDLAYKGERKTIPIFRSQRYSDSDLQSFAFHSFKVAKTWLKSCLEYHHDCSRYGETVLPRRLLFVGNGLQDIRLVMNDLPASGQYTCLSHRWGANQPLKTTRDNIEAFRRTIEWQTMPKTFQDAIKLTQYLGIQYLWVDSLCIIQDDVNDWVEESGNMCNIYENSYLTIAATSACEGSQGLSIRKSANYVRLSGELSSGILFDIVGHRRPHTSKNGHLTMGHPHAHYPTNDNPPLLSRAWTFQERILAPRVVHFCGEELMWVCGTMTYCECEPAHRGGTYPGGTVKHEFHRILKQRSSGLTVSGWHKMVQEYSALDLSHEDDKLPALSGLAKQNGRLRPSARYLAGLWSNSLMMDLLWSSWHVRDSEPRNSGLVKVDQKPTGWRAPSWSWAAQNVAVRFPASPPKTMLTYLKIHSCETTPATLDPTGKISAGSLVVSGSLHDVSIFRTFTEVQELKEGNKAEGRITLVIQSTGVRIRLPFILSNSDMYGLWTLGNSNIVAMDSPYDLLCPNQTEEYNGHYGKSGTKCLPLACLGYSELLQGKGKTVAEDLEEIEGNDKAEKNRVANESDDQDKANEGFDTFEEEGKGEDWKIPDSKQQDPEALVRSSAKYSMLLDKMEGENTYRRIGMFIELRTVRKDEPPRPMSALWRDNPSFLDPGGGVETNLIIK